MKNAPRLVTLEELLGPAPVARVNGNHTQIDGVWHPARPIGYFSWRSRLRLAWLVFTGKADALVWPGGQ